MKRVLIVDDESIVRVALRSLIDWEKHGYMVVRDCMGGRQAVEYIKENPVELLITDMKMPDMDGLELISHLGEIGLLPVTVVLSGYNEFELVREDVYKRQGLWMGIQIMENLTAALLWMQSGRKNARPSFPGFLMNLWNSALGQDNAGGFFIRKGDAAFR